MKHSSWYFFVLLFLGGPATAAEKVTYNDHIRGFFREHCSKCHNPEKTKGDLNLMSYNGVMTGSGSGDVVVPGDPASSVLIQVMTHESEPFMPPKKPKLGREDILIVQQWITGGLLESSGSTAKKVVQQRLAMRKTVSVKPEGDPAEPENLLLNPVLISSRANSVSSLAHSPWAPVLAVGAVGQVLLFNTASDRMSGVLPFPEGDPATLTFSRNGDLLLAGGGRGGHSGKAVVWDVKSGKRLFEAGDEYDTVLAADLSVDHAMIALSGPSKLVKIFSTLDGKRLHQIKKHTEWVTALAFSPDGVLLASGDRNGGLHIWEAYTGQRMYSLRGHKGGITSLSWRADSDVLASASKDGSIKLWAMESGRQLKQFTAHKEGVLSVAYSRDNRIASTGRNRELKIWDGNGKTLKTIKGFQDLPLSVAFTENGTSIISGDWLGNVGRWEIESGEKVFSYVVNPPPLIERVATVADALVLAETAWAAADGDYGKKRSAHDQAAARRQDMEKSLKELEKKHPDLQRQQKDVQRKRDQARRVRDAAQRTLRQRENRIKPLESKKATLEKDLKSREATRNKAVKLRDEFAKQAPPEKPVSLGNDASPEERTAWDSAAQEFQKSDKAYREKTGRLQSACHKADREYQGLTRQRSQHAGQLEVARKQRDEAGVKHESEKAACAELEEQYGTLSNSLSETGKALATVRRELPGIRKSCDELKESLALSEKERLAAEKIRSRCQSDLLYWKNALANFNEQT